MNTLLSSNLPSNAQMMIGQAGQRDLGTAIRDMQQQAAQSKGAEEAKRIAEDFEAVFIAEMLKPMFEGVDIANSPFGGGKGEEAFNSLLLQEYGKEVAASRDIGIAENVEKMILEIQAQNIQRTQSSDAPTRTIGDVINAYAATDQTQQR